MTAKPKKLKAPFVYPGGKSRIADMVWSRLGETWHYVEPFCGSASMLLGCPWTHKLEVINDQNLYVANFWRALQSQPDEVLKYCDLPCVHIELSARHRWLLEPTRVAELREKLLNVEYPGDAKMAGWWVWGMAHWIGSDWASKTPRSSVPNIGNAGIGVGKQLGTIPHISNAGRGVGKQAGVLGQWINQLSQRLRHVRVVNGSWERCLNFNYGGNDCYGNGSVSFFFDPPYKGFENLYKDQVPVACEVEKWCLEHGNNPKLRIALCGFEGDYDLPEWKQVAWKRGAGFNGSTKTATREVVWFSPHCLPSEIQGELDVQAQS